MRTVFVGSDERTIAQKLEAIKDNQNVKKKNIEKVLLRQTERQKAKQLDVKVREFMLGQIQILKSLGFKSNVICKYMDKPTMYSYYRFIAYAKKQQLKPYDGAWIYLIMTKTMGFLRNGTIYKLQNSADKNKWKLTRENCETIVVDKIAIKNRFESYCLSGTRYDA